jgi:hypothetical protein
MWERWERVRTLDNPTGYLFRVGLNQVRTHRAHPALAHPPEYAIARRPMKWNPGKLEPARLVGKLRDGVGPPC